MNKERIDRLNSLTAKIKDMEVELNILNAGETAYANSPSEDQKSDPHEKYAADITKEALDQILRSFKVAINDLERTAS